MLTRGPSRVALVMMGVCKSPDLPTYEISSISSKISALGDNTGAEGRRQEEMDDCRESQRRAKRNSLPQSTHWFSGQTVATVAAGNH